MNENLLLAGGGDFSGRINNPALGKFLNYRTLTTPEWYFQTFIPKGIGLLLMFGSLAFFFMFVWGSISWILSGGDKASVETAKSRITNAIIGLVLMVAVFAIVGLIESFFDINILSIDIGPLIIQ